MVQLGDIHLLAVFMSQICQQFETVQLWKFAVCLGYFNRCFLVTGSYFWWTSSFNLCSTDVGRYCSGCLVSDVNSQWFQLNFLRKSFLQLLCSYSRQYMDMTRRAMAHFQVPALPNPLWWEGDTSDLRGGLQTFAALVPFLCGNNFIDSGCWRVPAWISQRHWMIAGSHHRFGKRESVPFAGNSTT